MIIIKKILSIFLLTVMILAALTGCSVVKGDSENKAYDTLSDLENATLGIITGTNYDNVAKEKFSNAERMYFSTSADVLLALKQGKVDAQI